MINNCKQIMMSRFFYLGLILKAICLFYFPLYFPKHLFIPFLDSAVLNLGENPWNLNPPNFFPYGGALFSVLFIPKFILYQVFGELALGAKPLSLFALKLPLLVADFFILYFFIQFSPSRRDSIIKYYWLNPILFYISYVLGQLDAVSMFFLVWSIHELLKKRYWYSGALIGMALGCKFHIAICLPFLVAYIVNRDFFKNILINMGKWLCSLLAVAGLTFLPILLAHKGSYITLGSPEIDRLFAMRLYLADSINLYFGFIIVLIVLGRLIISSRITELGVIWGIGFLLSVLVISSLASPGWYYWSIPFLCLFYALYMNIPRIIYYLLIVLYGVYFAAPPSMFQHEILGFSFNNILYSTLITVFFSNIYYFWTRAVSREVYLRDKTDSFRIGIAGDSGSGKSVMTEVLTDLFVSKSTAVIEGDNYHRWERGDDRWKTVTHLNPEANQLFNLGTHVKYISQGRPVSHTVYSHETGRFINNRELLPSKTLIVQGLHTFYFESTRKLFDLKIFMSPEEDLRVAWKMQRDQEVRGHSRQQVLEQIERRKPDAMKYIDPQSVHADLIVQLFNADRDNSKLGCRWIFWNDMDLNDIWEELNRFGTKSSLTVDPERRDRVILEVTGEISAEMIASIANKFLSPIKHLTRATKAPLWRGGHEGVSQLVILLLVKKSFDQELL